MIWTISPLEGTADLIAEAIADADVSTGSGVGVGVCVGAGSAADGVGAMSGSADGAEHPLMDRMSMSARTGDADACRGKDPPGSCRA
ncbi:hypothetical protein C5C13_14630 [Clavibacter michiganensis]|nr:hypothetical protein C5C13_14630 [Clavibacter michiganensis]